MADYSGVNLRDMYNHPPPTELRDTYLHPPPAEETIITDPNTGGQKATKPMQLGLVDPEALTQLGLVAGMGAEKYEPWNYLRGYKWSLAYNAMMRHQTAFWAGQSTDDESGLPHMAHAAWHALSLVSFDLRNLGTDDRFKG